MDLSPEDRTRKETQEHIGNVRMFLEMIIRQIAVRAEGHDSSKLEEPEFSTFVEYTPKLKGSTYGSDEYKEFLKGMKVALDHHYKENSHHPEHFVNGIKGMSLIDLVELLSDWVAASKRHDTGNVAKSIEINQERFGYTDELKEILLNTIQLLGYKKDGTKT